MPTYIIKLHDKKFNKDYYLEYSSVVDAPITYGMTLDEFKEYYKDEYGNSGMEGLSQRLERVEKNGTSCRLSDNLKEFLCCNRAGDKERYASLETIIEKYCRNIPKE